MILPMISYQNHMISSMIIMMMMISLSSDISHDFIVNSPWYGCLISVSSDIIAMWYHTFPDMLAYIMAPARRDGAAWGRQALGAPPPPASPMWALATVKLGQSGFHYHSRAVISALTVRVSHLPCCMGQVMSAGVHPTGAHQSALWIWDMTAPTLGPQTRSLVRVQTYAHEYKRCYNAIAGNIKLFRAGTWIKNCSGKKNLKANLKQCEDQPTPTTEKALHALLSFGFGDCILNNFDL